MHPYTASKSGRSHLPVSSAGHSSGLGYYQKCLCKLAIVWKYERPSSRTTSHLLGKKSWNVYNPDNIERVRRDEANAKAEAIEKERRKQDTDSDRRLALLRGGDSELTDPSQDDISTRDIHRPRRRERPGADNGASPGAALEQPRQDKARVSGAVPSAENQGVRLSDALGYGSNGNEPWYGTNPTEGQYQSRNTGRDVWGNEDPRRQERYQQRMSSNDPLAAMKRGVKQLRKAESERQEWKAHRERDLDEVEEMARKERRHHRKRRSDADSIEGFDLDRGYRDRDENSRSKSREKHRHRHRHRHGDRHHDREHGSRNTDRDRSRSPERSKTR